MMLCTVCNKAMDDDETEQQQGSHILCMLYLLELGGEG